MFLKFTKCNTATKKLSVITEEGFFRFAFMYNYRKEHRVLTYVFLMQSNQNTSITGIHGSILLLTAFLQTFKNIKPAISLLCKVSNSLKVSHIPIVYS